MGTVGLSFGSPTSGAGFDVSSTVAEIVGNLQNVETPWKNQLTTLDSEDTAISNLGTLFSNLSNDMSSLTDFEGILAQKTGSSSDTNVLELTSATSSATAGTHSVVVENLAQTSSGYLDAIANASDTLSGALSIEVNGNTESFDMSSLSDPTLSGLASAINASGIGVTANVLTDSSGARLSLVSGTSGAAGQMTITSTIADPTSGTLDYNSTVTGKDANLTIDGVPLTSASNTVTNLIPGLTFQLLAPSPSTDSNGDLEAVQVVIGNDNSDVESTINQFVTDYNSLVSAMNTQEGNDSSGNPEPLFGSPTLSLLQQQLLSSVNMQNPNGYLTAISSGADATLSGSMTITNGSGVAETFAVGSGTSSGGTIYTGSGNNTLADLASAINSANTSSAVSYTASSDGTSGTMTANANAQLSGTLTIQLGNGTAQTIYLGPSADAPAGDLATGSSNNTLSSIVSYINANSSTLGISASATDDGGGWSTVTLSPTAANSGSTLAVTSDVTSPGLGVTAAVVTSNGQSTLTLTSQTDGSSGAVTATSTLATSPVTLSYTGLENDTGTTADSGTLGSVAASSDVLSGSITIQVGAGTAQTVHVGDSSTSDTISGLADAINAAGIGVTATVVNDSDGSLSLSLESGTNGPQGALTVTSAIQDTTTTSLDYSQSSDVNTLTDLGISVNNDGSLSFDASTLDSLLNSDFSSVAGFFQNANSWGQSFSTMLTNAGTGSSTGILALASSSNSSIESTLNREISNENSMISVEQASLTAELNSANEIMQQLPTQLEGVNELYSAITGYNENTGG